MFPHHPRRRFSGKLAALAAGTALALSPLAAAAAPTSVSDGSFRTASLTAAATAPAGPVAGFEDNAARAVYWLLEKVDDEGWTLDRALAVAGAGYAEAVRDDVLEWAETDGLDAAGDKPAYVGKLAQILGIYGESPEDFYPGNDLSVPLNEYIENPTGLIPNTAVFVVRGLAYTDAGVSDEAIDLLAGEQEENGSFGWGGQNLDITGWVTATLLAAGMEPDDAVIEDAVAAMLLQKKDNGGFSTDGNDNANANSTAIAAQALRAAGEEDIADEALEFLDSLQIGWTDLEAARIGQIAKDEAEYDGLLAGEPADQFSLNMTMTDAPAAFGNQPFGNLTAEGSVDERPTIPSEDDNDLVQPAPYDQTDNEAALLTAYWLQEELNDADGLMENYGSQDWGITLDTLQALAAVGTGKDAAEASLKRFASEGESYLNHGSSQVAKAAYTLLVYGKDPRTFFTDRDLLDELETAMDDAGAFGENVSPIGQSYAILAFERTTNGVPSQALEWLADQQCTDTQNANFGGFGVPFGESSACDVADADTTGLAVQALNVDPGENLSALANNDQAIAAGLDWLTENLNADGAIEAWGDTSVNSTAWAAQALGFFGEDPAHEQALAFLNDSVLTADDVSASDALQRADIGLIPNSSADHSTALAEGTAAILDSARFATAQAPLGMADRGMSELTAAEATAQAPTPEFASPTPPDSDEESGDDDSSNGDSTGDIGGGDSDSVLPAVPQKQQPSYAG